MVEPQTCANRSVDEQQQQQQQQQQGANPGNSQAGEAIVPGFSKLSRLAAAPTAPSSQPPSALLQVLQLPWNCIANVAQHLPGKERLQLLP